MAKTRPTTGDSAVTPRPVAKAAGLASRRLSPTEAQARRVIVEHLRPEIDGGRFPIKRTPGEHVTVTADVFADGHDVIVAVLRDRALGPTAPRHAPDDPASGDDGVWRETPMTLAAPGSDEWTAGFAVGAVGWHEYAVVAWVDRFRTWRRELQLKAAAGLDVSLELLEGALIVHEAAARAEQIGTGRPHAAWLTQQADALGSPEKVTTGAPDGRIARSLADELATVMDLYADRASATPTPTRRVWVDRERARFGAWYEMFPRSAGPDPTRSATFREAAGRLAPIADLGFDIVYLPPIHPIGRSFRKGRNNSLKAHPGDPGSPWAIGSEEGGHTAIEPGLGTFDDFAAFRAEAERLGLEVAIDLAWQCSPDHPWVKEHPGWFRHRPDGTIKYAENPPKKYQDIYPLDFTCDDWRGLWQALVDVMLFWVDQGVLIFRVDNPHTKTFGFWEWAIAEVRARDPRVIFLAEAFTRPKLMRYLAKAGFSQSYSYFTWRNTSPELTEYFTELTGTEVKEYLRPNLFANTPDILHAYLQRGGRAAFQARLLLAALLGASYGIYSGFELCEGRAVAGTEEYENSEKYQIRHWDWNRPGHIKELVARINAIRRRHPALQYDGTLRFHATDNPQLIAFSKSAPKEMNLADVVYVVVNLDPDHVQHGHVQVSPDLLPPVRAGADAGFTARDLIDDVEYRWRGEWNYVRLEPEVRQGHVLTFARST